VELWYIADRSTTPVVVAAQELTDSSERNSGRLAYLPNVAAGCAAFSAVYPTLVKTQLRVHPVIIRRAFYREVALSTAGIVAVLVVVFLLFGVTSALGRTVRGEYPPTIVLQLLGWQTLRRLDLLLPLGFYLGVLLTFSRWYRDNEMTVLAACGIGLSRLLPPVMLAAFLSGLLVCSISFFVSPVAARALETVKLEGSQRPELAGITPGAFTEAAAGGRILYAERAGLHGRLEQIFLSNPAKDDSRIVLAREGYPFVDNRTGDRFVMLINGWAYEGTPGEPNYRVVRYETYAVRLEQKPIVAPPTSTEGLSIAELFATPGADAAAERHWRLSKPVLVFVLSLYAMVLAYTDARRGRLANLFIAVFVYFIYSNLLGLGQTLIKKGQVSGTVGLWWVHVLMLAVALFIFYRRNQNRPLLPRLRALRAS
jgi:lipopolysaccharide export system permease protein